MVPGFQLSFPCVGLLGKVNYWGARNKQLPTSSCVTACHCRGAKPVFPQLPKRPGVKHSVSPGHTQKASGGHAGARGKPTTCSVLRLLTRDRPWTPGRTPKEPRLPEAEDHPGAGAGFQRPGREKLRARASPPGCYSVLLLTCFSSYFVARPNWPEVRGSENRISAVELTTLLRIFYGPYFKQFLEYIPLDNICWK